MLFVLGPQRTPSVAQIVHVCASAERDEDRSRLGSADHWIRGDALLMHLIPEVYYLTWRKS
jgi:hypothetical protein